MARLKKHAHQITAHNHGHWSPIDQYSLRLHWYLITSMAQTGSLRHREGIRLIVIPAVAPQEGWDIQIVHLHLGLRRNWLWRRRRFFCARHLYIFFDPIT